MPAKSRAQASRKRKREALKHADTPGAGAKKRDELRGREKVHVVMSEFKRGTLRSGSGETVTDRDQAIAIAMSEAGLSQKRKKARHREAK